MTEEELKEKLYILEVELMYLLKVLSEFEEGGALYD